MPLSWLCKGLKLEADVFCWLHQEGSSVICGNEYYVHVSSNIIHKTI